MLVCLELARDAIFMQPLPRERSAVLPSRWSRSLTPRFHAAREQYDQLCLNPAALTVVPDISAA